MIHYDPHRWLDHFFDIRGSLVKEIGLRVGLCTLWAVVVVVFHYNVMQVNTSVLLHSLVGVALGLLLVFRTNASYDRFWEGRKLWGGIVNETRNVGSRRQRLPGRRAGPSRQAHLLDRYFSLGRDEHAARGVELRSRSEPTDCRRTELDRASAASGFACCATHESVSPASAEARLITDVIQVSLDANVQALMDYVGGCERIRKTPLPFAYVVHLRRALVIYCFTLPFALVETFGWFTILDVLFVAYTFFGIEEIGVEIEGPFGDDANDLPMQSFCETIHNNVYALTGVTNPEREMMPEGL